MKQKAEVFEFMFGDLGRLPNLTRYRDLFSGVRTPVCGKKRGCVSRDESCNIRCSIFNKDLEDM